MELEGSGSVELAHSYSDEDATIEEHKGTGPPCRARLATSLLFFGSGLGIGGWASVVPVLQHRHALSHLALSAVLLAFALGAVCSMSVASRVAFRFGEDRTACTAAAAFGCVLILPALASSPAHLVVAALLLGAANGVLDVSMTAHATRIETQWGRAIMSSFHGTFSFGAMVGAAGMTALLARAQPLGQSLGFFAAVILLCSAGSVGMGLRRDMTALRVQSIEAHGEAPGKSQMTIAALAFFALMIEGAMADWSGVFMTEVGHAPVVDSGAAYAFFAGAMVVGRLAGDALVRRLGPVRILKFGGLIVAAAILLAVTVAQPWLICAGLAVCGLGMANVVPVLFSAAARTTPDHPTRGVATATMGGYAGFLLGPPLIGLGGDAFGLSASLAMLGIAGLVLCIGSGSTATNTAAPTEAGAPEQKHPESRREAATGSGGNRPKHQYERTPRPPR